MHSEAGMLVQRICYGVSSSKGGVTCDRLWAGPGQGGWGGAGEGKVTVLVVWPYLQSLCLNRQLP